MLAPGTQLGRYTVREHLGAGGMGDVYAAFDPNLGRTVAIKVLPDDAADTDRLARFVREARTVSALNHPNILTVFDFDHQYDTRFLVTELVEGQTFRQWCREERPALAELLDVLAQAASALSAAHAAGVVHRDVKPENLMRRHDGLVKVLDFGIAKLVAEDAPADGAATGPQYETQPGMVFGTVRYMSPEQALGRHLDARADVWSLGVVLYELVAGVPPFRASTSAATMALIVGREPQPLAALAPGTPEIVCRIAERALKKSPNERYATAEAMARELATAARVVRAGAARDGEQDEIRTMELELARTTDDRTTPTRTNLPPRASELIGRARELDELSALVRDAGERLVTLTGPGGTGKTRLAVEAGRRLLESFPDGVFAVDLSTVADPSAIAAHVAATLGLKESAGRSLAEDLERHLGDARMLLLLDNFEHLLAGAPFVSSLLAKAPHLTVLATSRAPLHLSAEREVAVEPLEVPTSVSLPPLEELASVAAVALFVERAHEARSTFSLTADNARLVVEICRRLDGLPLAIELAAARVKLLSPAAILERLERRLKLLTGGARDLPSRQQTMRATVSWSYELLEEAERAVLRRLAVFVGGCSIGAAEAVDDADELGVLDAVGSLVDKSLLRQRELEDGEMRFSMLEVVREFALERLDESGEAEAARFAHARYFRRFAEEAEPGLWSASQAEWIERLGFEYDNIAAAIGFLLEHSPDDAAALLWSIGQFLNVRGVFSQRRAWHLRALAAGPTTPALRARIVHGLSFSELWLGNAQAASEYAREAIEASRSCDDRRMLALALNGLGLALIDCDDPSGARAANMEALAIARELGDVVLTSIFLITIGELARGVGDVDAARDAYEQALDVTGRDERNLTNAVAHLNLGGLALEAGDAVAAGRSYRASLSFAAEVGDPSLSADALDGLAAVALARGAARRAARLAGAAEARSQQAGVQPGPTERDLRERTAAALRRALDPVALERERAAGRAMSLADAARAALEEEADGGTV